MSDFSLFLKLGFDHITDLAGYDHILFIVALCAIYRLQDWKVVLILVTAFTLGHSITLALATLNIIQYSTKTIELLIPCTILFTAIANFFSVDDKKPFAPVKSIQPIRYLMATGFGLIHGMGFSNYLRSLLGNEDSIWQPLLAFNIGLEIGQLVIVALSLVLAFVVLDIFRIKKHDWKLIVSGIIAGIILTMIKERWGK